MAKTIDDPVTGASVRLVTRREAGLRATSRAPNGAKLRQHAICHHGVGRGAGLTLAEAKAVWRGYERYHRSKGWTDIGYTAGWCDAPDVGGAVLEGRGWGKNGAHTQNGGNSRGYACCYIGDGRYTEGSDTAWRAWRAWMQWGKRAGAFHQIKVSGHDDWWRKVCPGPRIKHVLLTRSDLTTHEPEEDEDDLARMTEEAQVFWQQAYEDFQGKHGAQPTSLGHFARFYRALRGVSDSEAPDDLGREVGEGAKAGNRLQEVVSGVNSSIKGMAEGAVNLIRKDRGE